jgi:ABC-2 type transport system permease protein
MYKTYVIALREYRAAVRSKAFVITLVVMPILMAGSIVVQLLLKDQVDTSDKRFAIVDRSGHFKDTLTDAAAEYNEKQVFEGAGESRKKVKPEFVLEFVDSEQIGDPPESTWILSERVRKKEIYGFLDIGANVIEGTAGVTYHSINPVDGSFRAWASTELNEKIRQLRSEKEKVPDATVQRIVKAVEVEDQQLVTRNDKTGEISKPEKANEMAQIFLPMGLMMLIFMSVMVGATPLMQAVMEEKQARISEVLLGSIQPFQLMLGKLAGIVAVTLTTVLLYIAGAFFTLERLGHGDLFPPIQVILWLIMFQTLAVLMYGALFIAIGAAVSDMREAQSAMMPVMIFAMAPMFVWFYVVKEPDSTLSVALSLFPPATPMLMLLRLSGPSGVLLWQPVLGSVLVVLSTVFCVYAAGRIFRVGILMQGKGASLKQMASWVFRG